MCQNQNIVSYLVFNVHKLQIKNTSATTPIPNIAECKNGFQKYFDNIDKLQVVMNRISSDLTAMEESVAKAEEELGYNESGIKGFLKPFLGKVVKSDRLRNDVDPNRATGDKETSTFVPTNVFRASDYFASAGKSKEVKSTEDQWCAKWKTKKFEKIGSIFMFFSDLFKIFIAYNNWF